MPLNQFNIPSQAHSLRELRGELRGGAVDGGATLIESTDVGGSVIPLGE